IINVELFRMDGRRPDLSKFEKSYIYTTNQQRYDWQYKETTIMKFPRSLHKVKFAFKEPEDGNPFKSKNSVKRDDQNIVNPGEREFKNEQYGLVDEMLSILENAWKNPILRGENKKYQSEDTYFAEFIYPLLQTVLRKISENRGILKRVNLYYSPERQSESSRARKGDSEAKKPDAIFRVRILNKLLENLRELPKVLQVLYDGIKLFEVDLMLYVVVGNVAPLTTVNFAERKIAPLRKRKGIRGKEPEQTFNYHNKHQSTHLDSMLSA
ncbi:1205_t:CDS:2, partial [Ambispora leptoticha]